MKAPEGFKLPTPGDFSEWNYRLIERIGMLAGSGAETFEQRSRASFEADRALEVLTGKEWSRGWIAV